MRNSSLPTPARATTARAGDPARDERLPKGPRFLPHLAQKPRASGTPFASESLDADTASGPVFNLTHYPRPVLI